LVYFSRFGILYVHLKIWQSWVATLSFSAGSKFKKPISSVYRHDKWLNKLPIPAVNLKFYKSGGSRAKKATSNHSASDAMDGTLLVSQVALRHRNDVLVFWTFK
jgi:hypothetical protein